MNTIRELQQQEKYKSMLKRKNKEKKIYKDKNASLQLEKQRLYIALRNKDKEIERLNNIINELEKELNIAYKELQPNEMVIGQNLIKNIQITIVKKFIITLPRKRSHL